MKHKHAVEDYAARISAKTKARSYPIAGVHEEDRTLTLSRTRSQRSHIPQAAIALAENHRWAAAVLSVCLIRPHSDQNPID